GQIEPALFWFALKQRRDDLLLFQHDYVARFLSESTPDFRQPFLPLVALWYEEPGPRDSPHHSLSWHREGIVPLAVFRTSWSDSNALFIALKGGTAALPHAHMDAGSFVLEADGVRWAVDLDTSHDTPPKPSEADSTESAPESERWH